MAFMMKEVESYEQSMHTVFPMQNEVVPKHILIDSTILVDLLVTKLQDNKTDFKNT